MRAPILCTLALAAAASTFPPAAAVERAETVASYLGNFNEYAISGSGDRVVVERRIPLAGGGTLYTIARWDVATGFTTLAERAAPLLKGASLDHKGNAIAVIATGDLDGSGAEREELYRWQAATGWQRLTFTDSPFGLLSPEVRISDDGRRIAFASDDDYTGENPDGESQIFLWEEGRGIRQITTSTRCGEFGSNFLRDLSGYGNRIAFSSRCQFGKSNPDLQSDIFLWDEDTGVRPLTHGTAPVEASVTLDRKGTIAAFNVAATGGGFPGLPPIHPDSRRLVRWMEGQGFHKLSKQPISVYPPSISADGNRIAFVAANGQGGPLNPEGSDEVFLWQEGRGVSAVTDSAQSNPDFGNIRPVLDGDGTRLVVDALREFDAPEDNRSGLFVVDLLGARAGHDNLLVNGDFDDGFTGWRIGNGISYDFADARERPSSGSVNILATGTRGNGLSQCVSVAPGTTHILSAQLRARPDAAGVVATQVDFWSAKGCTGIPLGSVSPHRSARIDGLFTGHFARFLTPRGTRSARVRMLATDDGAGTPFLGTVDDVALRPENPSPILP